MAILRAGPFASSSVNFINQPTTVTQSILPVNCAKDTSSSSWPWKCYINVDGSNNDIESYSNGFPSISRTKTETIQVGDSLIIDIYFEFYVQCSSDITFTMTYNLSATTPTFPFSSALVYAEAYASNERSDGSNYVIVEESKANGGSGGGVTASLSGSETITVSASSEPQKVSFIASGVSGGNIEDSAGSVSLSFSIS